MPPPKFQYNLTFSLEGKMIRIVSKFSTMVAIWDIRSDRISTSQYPALMPPNKFWFTQQFYMDVLFEEFKD